MLLSVLFQVSVLSQNIGLPDECYKRYLGRFEKSARGGQIYQLKKYIFFFIDISSLS
jgi:hypothetical protein